MATKRLLHFTGCYFLLFGGRPRGKKESLSVLCASVGKFSTISSVMEFSRDNCGRCFVAALFSFHGWCLVSGVGVKSEIKE